MKRPIFYLVTSFILFSLFTISCKPDPVFNLTDFIKTGTSVDVASSMIGTGGGTVIVSKPGTPVDGMEINIPANSYTTSQTFSVSYSEIKSNNFGPNFHPISPMITIKCDGGYSSELMSITIPVKVPDGSIPIGFYLDATTGKLEGIPIENYTANSITLLTRHFLSGNTLRSGNSAQKMKAVETNKGANIIISSITESVLNAQPIISSGFKPGTDDWEFVNYGSYIATGGHCAGQNMAAMWYYFEKKSSDGQLFNKFSTVPTMQEDNAIGYRFCSVIHSDLDWNGRVVSIFDKYIDKNQELDKLKLLSIAGTMLITGEPQGIGIYMQTGLKADGTPKYGGHDLICYQVSVSSGKLYISDPNTPGTGQTIEFKNNKFQPYNAKANGHASANLYPFVTWYAKTAYIDWLQVGKRYAELLDSTIGNKAPNTFPAYTIWVKGKVDTELKDGLTLDSTTLRCVIECPTANMSWNDNGKKIIKFDMYNDKGNLISNWEGSGKGKTILKPGLNKIGFYIHSTKSDVKYDNGNYIDLYIDFKWFNVYYSKLKIDPNPIVGEPNKDIAIKAMPYGTAPANAKYVWNFGDGKSAVTVKNDSTVKYKYTKEGDFDVTVDLYDNSNNTLLGHATAKATVVNGILSRLQKYQYLSIDFNASIKSNVSYISFSALSIDNSPPWGTSQKCPLTWNGANFSTTYDYSWTSILGEKIHNTGTYSGTMSANGLIMNSLTAHETSTHPDSKDVYNYDISVTNVPYQSNYEYDAYSPRFAVDGTSVSSHISSYSQKWDFVDSKGVAGSLYSTSVDYTDPEDVPYLYITFSGSK